MPRCNDQGTGPLSSLLTVKIADPLEHRPLLQSGATRALRSSVRRGGLASLCALALALPTARPAASQEEELRSGALTFRFPTGQRRAAVALVAGVENPPQMPGLPPDILAYGQILIHLAVDEAAFLELAPGAPDWSGGIAYPQGDQIILPMYAPRAGGRPLATMLRHELAHVALTRYLGADVPRWFHEGYAQLAARSWGAEQAWTLRITILLGRLPALSALGLDFQRQRLDASHAYLLSYTAVEYLQRLGGAHGFTRLLENWRATGDLDRALRRTYGLTLSQFERMWRKDLRGRFGWLLLLTQTIVFWTALTILLLVLGYWKRRRTRRKLAALEEAVLAREAARRAELELLEQVEGTEGPGGTEDAKGMEAPEGTGGTGRSFGDAGYSPGVIDGKGPEA